MNRGRDDDDDELTDEDLALIQRLHQHPQEPPPPTVLSTDDMVRGIAALHSFDPAFDMRQFLNAVTSVFTLIRDAWNSNHPERALPLLDAGLARRWPEQWAAWQQQPSAIFNGVGIPNVRLVSITTAEMSDLIVTEVSLASELGPTTPEHRQSWSFTRERSEAQLTAARCPACGAPLPAKDPDQCRFCGAQVQGLAFTWLLAGTAEAGAPQIQL